MTEKVSGYKIIIIIIVIKQLYIIIMYYIMQTTSGFLGDFQKEQEKFERNQRYEKGDSNIINVAVLQCISLVVVLWAGQMPGFLLGWGTMKRNR